MSEPAMRLVCVVDDDDDVRNSLRALLESSGFAVETFSSAAQFLESASGSRAACLLLDLQMPVMSGLELLELLRARAIWTPAIFLTANGFKLERRIANTQALAVLRKPVDDEELLRWLEKASADRA